jgi:beta-phosphoglucomutase
MSLWPRAILFDFDNVLVNSEPLHFFAFHSVLKEEKLELTESEYYGELLGFDDRGAFRHIFEKHGRRLDPKTALRVMTRKKEAMLEQIYSHKYSALPGVEAFVRGIWRHYPLAICSGALRDEIELMLEGIALRDCFSVIVSAEDVAKGKPDPGGYLLALQQLSEKRKTKFLPSECLIIEDAPLVIKPVRAEGFPVLGLANTLPAEKLLAAKANWVVASLDPDDVQKVIPGLRMTR